MRTLLCCALFVVRFLLCAVLLCDLASVLVHFMAGVELLTGVYLLSYHGAPEHGIFSKITLTAVPSNPGQQGTDSWVFDDFDV